MMSLPRSLMTMLIGCGLLLTAGQRAFAQASADEVNAAVRKALNVIPGDKAFAFTELTDDGPKLVFGFNESERFAIGSSFKLFILGTLAEEVNSDRRELANVMKLKPEWIGPPHSELADWPIGSPVSLNTLALKMISISDNTATDHLLHLLGREPIEKQMAAMGHSHPQWNTPLLSTREMTMLRDKNRGLLGKKYETLDEAAKRQFLAEHTQGIADYDKLDFDTAAYKLAEWYATPLDMAHALAWLKNETGSKSPAHLLRGVLAVETKLTYDSKVWPYIGFKGGSEDQILCGNWLMQNQNGHWYTFHVYLNNPQDKLDPAVAVKAIEQVFQTVQDAIETNEK